MKKKIALCCGVAVAAFIAPAAAIAQAPPSDSEVDSNVDDATDATLRDPAAEGIIVTADRRPQLLQNYAGTAAVLSPDALARVGIVNIENLNDTLPGLRVQNFGGAVQIALRGIGTNQNTELGDPNVATHFDDVYVPRVQGLANAYFDLRAVEVNFGPQGTLRGRNASAGSLNFIANEPELGAFRGALEGGYGNFEQVSAKGIINIPIGDVLAFRVSASFDKHGAYYNNVGRFPEVEAPYADDNRGVRAQLLFEPSPNFSILLAGDYNDQTSTGFNGSNFSAFLAAEGDFQEVADSVENPRDILTGPLGEEYFTKHGGLRAKATYRTDGLFNVQYIGSYRDLRFGGDGAGPSGVAAPGFDETFFGGALGAERLDNYSQGTSRNNSRSDFHELRFFNDTEPLKYSLGANYFNERQRTISLSVADFNSFFQGQEFNTRTQSEVYAFYGDATYSLTERLRLTAGARYTEDSKSRTGVISRYFFGGFGANFDECCGFYRIGTPGFEFNTDRTIFTGDQNGDGISSTGEQLTFFLDGVRRFGARDTIPIVFADAIADFARDPSLITDPNYGLGNIFSDPPSPLPGCTTSAQNPNYQCGPGNTYIFSFLAHTINDQSAQISTDFFDWRGRIEYDLTDDNLVYALISRGHKAASFNDNLGSLGPAPFFRPESVTLYEVGTKNEFDVFGRRAVFNLSAFYNDYNDQQLTALLGVQSIVDQITAPDGTLIDVAGPQILPTGFSQNQVVAFTYNAANSETYGIQGSGSITLPGNFKFGADFLYLEANIKDADPVQDFRFQSDVNETDSVLRPIAGRRLPYTPKFQLNASLAQVIPVSGRLGGTFDWLVSVSYRSSSFATIFNSTDFAFENREVFTSGANVGQIRITEPRASLEDNIPAYALVNLAIGYTHENVRLEGYVNNLFDNTVAAGLLVSQFSNTRFFTNPRLIGGRVRVTF